MHLTDGLGIEGILNMLWIVLVFIIHCVTAFVLSYCFDTAKLWKDDEEPSIRMPSIYDLPDDCDRYTMEKYINKQIIPAHNYFSLKSEIKGMQNYEHESIVVYLVVHTVSTLLIGFSLFKMDIMPKFLCVALPLVVCVAASFLENLIYKKSKFVICSNRRNATSLKKEYDEWKERNNRVIEQQNREHLDLRFTGFEIDEEDDLNNFVISEHCYYLKVIHNTVKRRYYVRKCITFICGAIYILFIMRVPD